MTTTNDFIFDEWLKLAQQDKDNFEEERKNYIQNYIDTIPEKYRDRMIRIQWRLDTERKSSKSAIESCIKMYTQMWKSFHGPDSLSSHLNEFSLYLDKPKEKSSLNYLKKVQTKKNNVTNIKSRCLETS